MTLKNLIDAIARLAIDEKLINSSAAGSSMYQINGENINAYPLLFQTPAGNHLITDTTTTYNITLYFADRLLDDFSNDIDIYSTAIEQLKNLVKKIDTIDGVLKVEEDYNIQNFNGIETFDDRLCGAFATIQVITSNSFCAE